MPNLFNPLQYEFYNVSLPLVQIICKDDNGIEVVTVIEDCTGWELGMVLDACDDTYNNWKESRS